MSNSFRPHGLYSPWNSLGQNTRVRSLSLLQGILPTQRSNPGLPHCRHSLPAELQGKPKNTGVGILSLLQWIFLTQESNKDHLHCRQILYQLTYQGFNVQCSSYTLLFNKPPQAFYYCHDWVDEKFEQVLLDNLPAPYGIYWSHLVMSSWWLS